VKAIYGLHTEPSVVQKAVDNLRASGIADRDILVISSEPIEEWEFSHRDAATWLYWIAGGGGVVGLAAAVLLTTATENAWPLTTGRMPIVSWWPNMVIMFELTMLGAILATVITLLVTTKLGRQPPLYDIEVADGQILVGVVASGGASLDAVTGALVGSGISTVKTIDSLS
jgi:ActD protein